MAAFSPWVTPIYQSWQDLSPTGWILSYEGISTHIDCLGPLLYSLFQEHWAQVQLGHVVEGGVLELAFKDPPSLCVLYDGYLTVATETWHLHLCLEEHLGGPYNKTSSGLRKQRLVSRAALYQRLNPEGKPRMWGIQVQWSSILGTVPGTHESPLKLPSKLCKAIWFIIVP